MKIVQTKGMIGDGGLRVSVPENMKNGEVDVIIVAPEEPNQFERRYQMMQEKGYNTPEKVRDLIHQLKLDMLKEKGRAE